MGAGKSTYAKQLADLMEIKYIDLDSEIEKESKKSISAIFQKDGEDKFRELESKILKKLIANHENEDYVMALGGGTPCYHQNMELIKTSGISIYLKVSEQELIDRLKDEKSDRPLLKYLDEDALPKFISEKLRERTLYYVQSDITISVKDLPAIQLHNFLKNQIEINQ